jgi:hypothetical protein
MSFFAGIDHSLLVRWRRNLLDPSTSPTDKRKHNHAGPKTMFINIETLLLNYVDDKRAGGYALSSQALITRAGQLDPHFAALSFDLQRSWIYRFMKRNNLSIRVKTHSGTYIEEAEMDATILDFVKSVRSTIDTLGFAKETVFNMDQTAVFCKL